MTTYYQMRSLQDKTRLKGVYFFFSFIICLIFAVKSGLITTDIFNSLYQYIILISIASIIAAFLYYINFGDLLLKSWLIIKEKYMKFNVHENVRYHESIDHIFIFEEKNQFLSKLIFTISFFLISFLFLEIEGIIFICSFVLIAIILSFYITLKVMRTLFNIQLPFSLLSLFLTSFLAIASVIFIHDLNFLAFVVLVMTCILIISIVQSWKNLEYRMVLGFFMTLIYQFKDLEKMDDTTSSFLENMEKNLWNEARTDFQKIIEKKFPFQIKEDEFIQVTSSINAFALFCNRYDPEYKDTENIEMINVLFSKKESQLKFEEIDIKVFLTSLERIYDSFERFLKYIKILTKLDKWMELFFIVPSNRKDYSQEYHKAKLVVDKINSIFKSNIPRIKGDNPYKSDSFKEMVKRSFNSQLKLFMEKESGAIKYLKDIIKKVDKSSSVILTTLLNIYEDIEKKLTFLYSVLQLKERIIEE